MKSQFLFRLPAFLLLFTFSFQQIALSFPMSPLPLAGSTSSPASLFPEAGLIQNSRSIFQNLREQGFKYVTDSLQNGFRNLLKQLNPLTSYRNLAESVTQSLHKLGQQNGFARFLADVTQKISIQIAQNRIDKTREKSKMNSFLQSVLSTVSSAGIQAVGRSISQGIISPILSQITESLGLRGPPANLPRIQYDPRDEARYLWGSEGKSGEVYFGNRRGSDPFGLGPIDFNRPYEGEGVTFGYSLDQNGLPAFARLLGAGYYSRTPELTYATQRNPDSVSFRDDDANLFDSRRDPATGRYRAPTRVGNLPEIRRPSGTRPFDLPLEADNGLFSAAWFNRYRKIGQGVTALGATLENFTRPVVNELGEVIGQKEYTKVFGSKAAREAAGFKPNANVFKATTQAVAKYTNVVSAARAAAKNALIVGVAINVIDDVTVGIANGHSRAQIASNIIIDSGITLVSNVAGAVVGTLVAPYLPGANILVGVGTSLFVSEVLLKPLVAHFDLRNKLTTFINQGVSIFNPSRSAIDLRDERLLFDPIRRDSFRRYYGWF